MHSLTVEDPRRWCRFALVSFALLALIAAALLLAPAARAKAARGVVDNRLEYSNRVPMHRIAEFVDEIGPAGAGARWTRVMVRWNWLQPVAPGGFNPGDLDGDGYDDHYVAELEAVMSTLHSRGIRVILTGNDIPQWAANPRYLKDNHLHSAVIRSGNPRVMAEFRRFAQFLAGHFLKWKVRHFEVWNEPNLSGGIYPQIVGKKPVGPAAYLKMLKAFYAGAKSANRGAVVIAGATSRFGSNGTDPGSTSPQWFARYLRSHRAARWFDAYSHHPYTKRGSDPVPSVPPNQVRKAVTLGNIKTLLNIFPDKPFYLTEFCYSTAPVQDLFCVVVSESDQARYLRQAYAWVDRYPQIKVMLWFLIRDWEKDPVALPGVGVYTGLLDPAGERKPAWYAFVGGNTLTATAPTSVAAWSQFTVGGVLTTKDGPGAGILVLLQRRYPLGTWSTVETAPAETDASGRYSLTVTRTGDWEYRVVWDGVCESEPFTVSAR